MYETRTIAEWAIDLKLVDIPETVKDHARCFILDNFGCQVAGQPYLGAKITAKS